MTSQAEFSTDDIELLVAVLSLNSSMLAAAHGVRMLEGSIKYPITSINDIGSVIESLAGKDSSLQVGPCTVTFQQAGQYMPAEMFPIENREQLIGRLVLAFEKQRIEVLDALAAEQSQRQLGAQAPEV